jgi:uncharacterized protein (TIGR02599 family)
MAILALILVFLLQVVDFASGNWRRTSDRTKAFQAARTAFDSITRDLSQATLNPSSDYYDSSRQSRSVLAAQATTESGRRAVLKAFVPDTYGRQSDLHFVSGRGLIPNQHNHAIFFQAPLDFDGSTGNADNQLNAVGYFVEYDSDVKNRPPNVPAGSPPPRERFRLMQFLQKTSALDVYRETDGRAWFTTDLAGTDPSVHLLAENIVAFVVLPKLPDQDAAPLDSLAPGYSYDSRTNWPSSAPPVPQPIQMHQLPPMVRVVMVAIDEATAARKPGLGAEFADLFKEPADLDTDLITVRRALTDAGATFQIFQTDVPIRSAKWSE